MEQEKKCIITITRQFGSLGRPIAKLVSEKLNIQYYDRDIVEQASEQLCLPVSQIDQLEEKAEKATRNGFMRMMYPLGTQTSAMQNKIFEAQKNIMDSGCLYTMTTYSIHQVVNPRVKDLKITTGLMLTCREAYIEE